MKIFTCTNHDTHWPIGGASIIIAKDRKQGKKLLDKELESQGLKPFKQEPYTLVEISSNKARAIILCDGEY